MQNVHFQFGNLFSQRAVKNITHLVEIGPPPYNRKEKIPELLKEPIKEIVIDEKDLINMLNKTTTEEKK